MGVISAGGVNGEDRRKVLRMAIGASEAGLLDKLPSRVRSQRSGLCRQERRPVVSAFIATAFAQEAAEAPKLQWRKVADQLRPTVFKLAALMDSAEEDVLAYMSFSPQNRTELHSTDPFERVKGEIKRHNARASRSSPTRTPTRRWKALRSWAKILS